MNIRIDIPLYRQNIPPAFFSRGSGSALLAAADFEHLRARNLLKFGQGVLIGLSPVFR
jgi:hypothetical protein